jgi:hypothetical protein
MARFSISFAIATKDEAAPTYRVRVSTGLEGSFGGNVDSNLLVITRSEGPDGIYVDTFYGLVKPSDFAAMSRAKPKPGETFYRVCEWNLVFYNLKTMNEAIALMKMQIDILADDMKVFSMEQNNRYETHVSNSF